MPEEKNYDLVLEERPLYVFAHVKAAELTEEIVIGFLGEATSHCRKLNIDRLLLVREIPVMISEAEIFLASKKFLEMIRGIKIAIVNPFPELQESLHFFQLVTSNRGAKHNTFTNIPDAEAWLLKV